MGRLVLPLFAELARERPSIDAVRRKLGGRVVSEPGVGLIVRLETADQPSARFGVVLCVEGGELYVVTEQSVVHKISRARAVIVEPSDPASGPGISALSADARVFASLSEGQEVRYLDEASHPVAGTLLERCRFGAIVRRADGVVMGVGFRKIWPGDAASAPS